MEGPLMIAKGTGGALVVSLFLLTCGPSKIEPHAQSAPLPESRAEKVASGFLLTVPPKDLDLPANSKKKPVRPKVTEDFRGTPTSNDWWSSLIWENDTKETNPYSDAMYAHPLTLKAEA